MKPRGLSVLVQGVLLLAFFLVVSPGCISKPKTGWDQRVGKLTYDQAVAELGPPVNSALHPDGSKMAEWFLKPGPRISFGLGTALHDEAGGATVSDSVGLPTPGHYLRLVFGLEGQLRSWERFRR